MVNYYRTKPGKFDDYMKYLRANYLKSVAKQKQAGIIIDSKVLINPAISGPDDWDVAVEDQMEKISAEISGERNKDKRNDKIDATRMPLRDFLRTRFLREITLKP